MLPKEIKSIWTATTPDTGYPALGNAVSTDIIIIGAGIAGLTAAYFFVREGYKVIVIDAHRIATGTSGNTTAKITSQHHLRYSYLLKDFGFEKAQIYADSNQWAVGEAERIVQEEHIDCDLLKLPAHIYSQTDEGLEEIIRETGAAQKLGLPATFLRDLDDLPFPVTGAIRFDNQACFHPRRFLLALAEIIRKRGALIYEETPALDIIEEEEVLVVTPGCNISAEYAVIATDLPFKSKSGAFGSLYTSPSYVLAAKLEGPLPQGMFIALDGNLLSFRPHRAGDKEWLLIGGESGEGGETEDIDHFAKLEENARNNFTIKQIDFRWAAEDTMSPDKIPLIGKIPGTTRQFVTTGYNKWGMTTSFVSARILTNLVSEKKDDVCSGLYAPARLSEKVSAQRQTGIERTPVYNELKAWQARIQKLKPETGEVISHDNKRIAIYKDTDGRLHTHSAICTHMGCTVGWNDKDKTWDCPCHGSRYDKDGHVIRGPAKKPLEKVSFDDN